MRISSIIVLGLVSTATPVAGQSASNGAPPVATAVRTEQAPRIDGVLDDVVWQRANIMREFVQHEPIDGAPPSERTEVRILYDRRAIYVGAWLYDRNASAIVLGEARRDVDLTNMDAFLIVLDTYHDQQNGFVFGTTPSGIEYDGQVTKEGEGNALPDRRMQAGSGGGFNINWDGSWDVATSRDANGWYAEFRIPYATLRYTGSGEQMWGMNMARYIRRNNEQIFWSPVPRQFTLYRVSLAGTLQGVEVPARRTVDITPYVLSSFDRDGTIDTTDWNGEAGLDLKAVLTPSLTLDLTANTDFAQVEVDDQQVNLTRFALFFPEKRPFFLENAGTFAVGTPQQVEFFFSRRIGIGAGGTPVPILGGGRLTGRVAGFTFGLLNIQTRDVRDPGGGTVVAPTNYGALRLLREFPNRTRLGGILATRLNTDSTADYNLTYGVDGQLGVGEFLTFDAYGGRTETPGRTGGEHAYQMGATFNNRDWTLAGQFRGVAADFNPEVGFLTRSAYYSANARVLRRIRFSNVSWFREMRPHISYREFLDLDWFSSTRLIHIDSHFEFANGAFFQLPAINFTREGLKAPFEIASGVFVPAATYDNVEWGFAYNTNLASPISVQGRIDIGGFYSGHRKGGTGSVNGRVGSSFASGLGFTYYDVDLAEGAFETLLVSLRLSYAFTPRVYVQALVQYRDDFVEGATVSDPGSFSANVRFGWLNTAGTGLFLVYNEVSDEIAGAAADERSVWDPLARSWASQNRAFIVKYTQRLRVGG